MPLHSTQQKSAVSEITPGAKKLFRALYLAKNPREETNENIPKIQVSDMISKISFYYEKIRNAVHYTEEHLLRKDAIFRILKRQLVIEGSLRLVKPNDTKLIAEHLLTELIRAGYLPNNTLPETMTEEVSILIQKYVALKKIFLSDSTGRFNFFSAKNSYNTLDSRSDLTNWLLGLAASEIEEKVEPDQVVKTVTTVMFKLLEKRVELPVSLPYERDLPIQLYLAISRVFGRLDEDMLSLVLMRYFNEEWDEPSPTELKKIAKNLATMKKAVDDQLEHPLSAQLKRVVSSYTVYFRILEDVAREDPVAVYDALAADPASFAHLVRKACNKRYTQAKRKLWRAAVRSIIYILLTKSVFVVLLEVPATEFFGQHTNALSLLINIAFPAALLFFAIAITRLPGKENTDRILAGIEEIVFMKKRKQEPITLRKPVGRHPVINVIFGLIYTVTFFITFGGVIWILDSIQFSWVSIIIFVFFLAFVSFFIIRIRRTAKEWIVVPPKENFIRFLVDFFSVPVVATGKWLSGKFARLNVFAFILDFIIEAPLKILIEVAEQWTKYVRERKEEL